MQSFIPRLFSMLMALSLTLVCSFATTTFAATPQAIVISPDASKVTTFAASELQQYLTQATGTTLPIVTEAATSQSNIYVGPSAYTQAQKIDVAPLYPDGYLIQSIGQNTVILGDDSPRGARAGLPFDPRDSRKGTLYGVYRFLENQYGVRWLWPGENGQVVPVDQSLDLPENLNTQSKPVMLWRHLFLNAQSTLSAKQVQDSYLWYMRQGMGISIGSPYSFSHSWAQWIDGNKNFEAHPEWYSLIKGKRMPFAVDAKGKLRPMSQQVCTSNPEVVAYFVNKIQNKYATDADIIVSLSPNDGDGFCECDNCTALDHPELYNQDEGHQGISHADRIFGFVSEIAKQVKQTHPNVRVGCFAYTFASQAPRALESLDSNVVISFTQTVQNTNRDTHRLAQHRARLNEWLKMGNKIVLRDYIAYIGQAAAIQPISGWVNDEIQNAAKHPDRVMGFYSETTFSGMFSNHLDFYIMARLTWDPTQDVSAIKSDFFEHGYLSAAGAMSNFYAQLETAYAKPSMAESGFVQGIDLWLTPQVVHSAYASLDQAQAAVKNNPQVLGRIKTVRTMFDYTVTLGELVRNMRTMADAGLPMRLPGYTPQPTTNPPTNAQIMHMINTTSQAYDKTLATIKTLEEDRDNVIHTGDGFRIRDRYWRWGATLAEYRELFADTTRIPTTLPVVWKFKLDPEKQGESQQWYASSLDDLWTDIRIDDTWENQGYGQEKYGTPEGYNGLAWYRLDQLNIPTTDADHKTILWLGAVDESCKVYVNGKYIGQSIYDPAIDPDGWKKARQFDISHAIVQGANNTIAVLVQDDSGHGGIWKSAWLLTTLTDEAAADQPLDLFNENFEAPNWKTRAASVHLNTEDQVDTADGVLKIKVSQGLPEGKTSITWVVNDVKGDTNLSFEFRTRTSNLEENAGLDALWQRRPKAPQVRIIPINEARKAAVAPKDYQWVGLKFAPSSDGWQRIVRVFRVTKDTRQLHVTMYLHAKGDYEIDDLIVRQVK